MALGETETQQQQQNEKCWLHDKGFFSDARQEFSLTNAEPWENFASELGRSCPGERALALLFTIK